MKCLALIHAHTVAYVRLSDGFRSVVKQLEHNLILRLVFALETGYMNSF